MPTKLTDAEAAYLAGLIDGEGTVTLSRIHRNQMRYLVLSVCNNELGIIDWVHSVTGIGKITRKRRASAHHGLNLTWRVSSRRALSVLETVSPYMHSYKRKRAELALARYLEVTPRNGKYNEAIRAARAAFEAEFFAIGP